MKLAIAQLEQHLTKPLSSIYIVSSDEFLLVQETVELIRQATQQQGFADRTLITADTHGEWAKTLFSNTHCISLFSSKQCIELNMHSIKFNATTTKALQEYAEQPKADTVLLIRTNKIDGKTEKSNWFQSLEKKSIYVSLWPITPTQLPQWILQRSKKMGLTLTKNAADLIANQAEGNLLAAAQELEKLFLYRMTESPTNNEHEEFFTDNARFDVFTLVESVLAGNKVRALRILKNLAAEDTEPTLILWALTREFRTMAEMMKQLKQGASFSSLCSKFQIYEKRQASVKAFIQRQTIEKCWDLLLNAAQIDRIIKGAETGNIWDRLESIACSA